MTRQPTPDILDDLFRNQPAASMVQVALDDIADNPFQPRQSYDQAALEELAASIRIAEKALEEQVRQLRAFTGIADHQAGGA